MGSDTRVPPEQWIPYPVSDSAEYLDRAPVYVGDLTDEAKAEYEAAERAQQEKARRPRRRRRKRNP